MSANRTKQFTLGLCCSSCFALAAVNRAVPRMEDGHRTFTDGFDIEPGFIDNPVIARCTSCEAFYWCDDGVAAHSTRSSVPTDFNYATAYAGANWIGDPTEQEVYEALRQGMAKTIEQEIRLRLEAWQRRNDAYRYLDQDEATHAPEMSDDCRANLQALVSILDDSGPTHCLLKCNALRECGEFDRARALLDRLTEPKFAQRVAVLKELCIAGDVRVRQYPEQKRRTQTRKL